MISGVYVLTYRMDTGNACLYQVLCHGQHWANTYLFSGLKIDCGSAPVNPHDGRTQSSDLAL